MGIGKAPFANKRFDLTLFRVHLSGAGTHVCVLFCLRSLMRAGKIILAAAVVLFNLPNTSAIYWVRPVDTPAFLRQSSYQHYLSRNQIVFNLALFIYWQLTAVAGTDAHVLRYGGRYFALSRTVGVFALAYLCEVSPQRAFVPDAAEQFRGL